MIHKVHPKLHTLLIPIDSLSLDPDNAMDHDNRSISAIAESLNEYGQDVPVIVQDAGMIVRIGNGRVEAALSLGWTHIAAVVRTDAEITMIARAVADNRTAQLGTWNRDALAQAYAIMRSEDKAMIGWREDELAAVLSAVDPEPLAEPDYEAGPAANDPFEEWKGMPEYDNQNLKPKKRITVYFGCAEDMEDFSQLVGVAITEATRSHYFPGVVSMTELDKRIVNES